MLQSLWCPDQVGGGIFPSRRKLFSCTAPLVAAFARRTHGVTQRSISGSTVTVDTGFFVVIGCSSHDAQQSRCVHSR